jgi:hypothetical protein
MSLGRLLTRKRGLKIQKYVILAFFIGRFLSTGSIVMENTSISEIVDI